MQIISLKVENFRSLKKVEIKDIASELAFVGLNDTGKSNILAFLEILFKTKRIRSQTEVSQEENEREESREQFWEGVIHNFSDNFHHTSDGIIDYDVEIQFDRSELESVVALPKDFLSALPSEESKDVLKIIGQLKRSSPNIATANLVRAEFDGQIFYDGTKSGADRYLPGFEKAGGAGEKAQAFEGIMHSLDDAFLRIPANRFLTIEHGGSENTNIQLRPSTLKNWLLSTSLDPNKEHLFREIQERFASEPFSHGRMTIGRPQGSLIEIFVENDKGVKLPIGRKGSGIQQILMMLSYIVQLNAPFVGIEEPEINLSRKSQIDIIETLRLFLQSEDSPINQLFITTHSPKIGAMHSAKNMRYIKLDDDGNTLIRPGNDPEIEDFNFGVIKDAKKK